MGFEHFWLYIVMLKTSAYRVWSECYLTSTDLNEELHGKVCSPFSYLRWYNCNGYLPFFFYCMAKWCIAETLLILRSLETKLTMKVAFNTLFDIYIIIIHRHTFIISLYICIYYHIIVIICILAVYRRNNWDAGETSETYFSGKKTTGNIHIHSCSSLMC